MNLKCPAFLLLFSLLTLSFPTWAATPAGQVILAQGNVQAIGADKTTRTLARGNPFYQSDTLVTARNAQAKLRFTDGTLITLNPNSRIRVESYRYQEGGSNSYIMNLTTGGFRTVSGAIAKQDPSAYQVRTPVATIAVRGTDYSAAYSRATGLVTAVWEGTIELKNDSGSLLVGEQQKFHYAQIKSLYAMPEGLTQMPKALISGGSVPPTPPTTNTATESSSIESSSNEKSELLEICFP